MESSHSQSWLQPSVPMLLAAEDYFDGIEIRRDDVLLVDGHTLSLSAVGHTVDGHTFGPCIRRGAILLGVGWWLAQRGRLTYVGVVGATGSSLPCLVAAS